MSSPKHSLKIYLVVVESAIESSVDLQANKVVNVFVVPIDNACRE
jgi:hypothetical protein